ncbi:MAG: ferrous iron transport protein A [Anaerolineae bacterium]|nr:ferrous iron transport protein A [Anaerolineae bacterium]
MTFVTVSARRVSCILVERCTLYFCGSKAVNITLGAQQQTLTSKTLDQLAAGQMATIRRVSGEGPLRRRMLEMGITRGTTIEMIRRSPFGDPIEYRLRGYHLSLRRSEARLIEIEL